MDEPLVPSSWTEDAAAAAPDCFVAVSRFKVRNGMSRDVLEAFLQRPGLVDSANGFLRMEVMRPTGDPDEFWLFTWWRSEDDFRTWHRSHQYRESHAGIPKGLKLDPSFTTMMFFERVAT